MRSILMVEQIKNPIAQAALLVLIIIVLNELGVFNALVMFLLVGAIPGTDYSLPSGFMLLVMIVLLGVILYKFAGKKAVRSRTAKKLLKRAKAHKKRMPRRRFSEI
ncbi:MAG TPA: hypothetical protein VFZ62_04705 [Candidatus Saccharimonadales bacterium]